MVRKCYLSVLLIASVCRLASPTTGSAADQDLSQQVSEYIRNRLEAADMPPRVAVGEENIHSSLVLPRFYENRGYRPAWTGDGGPDWSKVDSLVGILREAPREGLRPDDYHLSKIEVVAFEVRRNQRTGKPLNPRRLVDLDLLLTDAFLIYGSHLLAGCIDPETIDPEWRADRRAADLAAILQSALDNNRIAEALLGLLPPQPVYDSLKQALACYRRFAEEGGTIAPDRTEYGALALAAPEFG